MGQIYKADFQVDDGTDFDKYNFSTTADQVSYTKNGKETNVQAELDAVNTGIADYKNTNLANWTANWQGGVTYTVNSNTGIRKLFGTITHKVTTVPEWGEVVGSLPGIRLSYVLPFAVYSTRGQVYNALVLTAAGEIRVYGSDKSKLVNANERLEFCIAF